MSSNNPILAKRNVEIKKKLSKKLEQKANNLRIEAYKMKKKNPNSSHVYNKIFDRASQLQYKSNVLVDIKPTWG